MVNHTRAAPSHLAFMGARRDAGASPPLVKQLVPILEQLTPIYMDVANGTQEFNPPPEETRRIIRQGKRAWATIPAPLPRGGLP